MKRIEDGLGKTVRTVMIVVGMVLTIFAFTAMCTSAKADNKPKVGILPDGQVLIDATHYHGEGCGLTTYSPDVAGVFYDYVTDKITSPEFAVRMRNILMSVGWTKDEATKFANDGVLACTVGRNS
jgi:hypothetical protein